MVCTRVINTSSSQRNKADLEAFLATGEFICSTDVLSDGKHKFIVLLDRGHIVAYVLVRFMPKSMEVVQVFSQQQGRGLGKKAMQEVEAIGKYHGSRRVWLDSLRKARGFYDKIGYLTLDGKRYRKSLR